MDLPVLPKLLPFASREEYERHVAEWGEKGPSHNVDYRITSGNRTNIVLNHTGNVPVNSMEQQKERTFL